MTDASAAGDGRLPVEGRARTLVLIGLAFGALLMVLYWTLWFGARDLVASGTSEAYYDFENAFPLADLWLLVCVVCGFAAVLQRRASALFWLLVGGGAGVYLGCMDLLYDLEHGIFTSGSAGAFEAVIVIATFVLSVSILRWSWRRRRSLLEG